MSKVTLILILILGGLLRFWQLGANSLWKDELFSMIEAQKPIVEIFTSKTWFFGYNPIHYFFTHLALYFGKSEALVRTPAVIFGLLTILVIYKLGKVIFNQKVGLLSAFLLSISPLHLKYSREVRYYSFLIFFSSLTILFIYKIISEKKKNIWVILFALASLLNIATQPNALLVLGAEMMFLLVWFWRKKKFLGLAKKIRRRKAKETLVIIGIILISIFLGSVFVKSFGELFAMAKFAPAMSPFVFLTYILTNLSAGKGTLAIYLSPFILGLITSYKKKREVFFLLLLFMVLPLLTFYFVRPAAVFDFHIRYVSFIVIPYLLLISYGIDTLLKRNVFVFLAVLLFALLSIQPINAYYQTKKGDWRGVEEYLIKNAKPGDVVITENYYNKILLDYYLRSKEHGLILKKAVEPLMPRSYPFRIFFHQHDYSLGDKPNSDGLPMIDFKKIVAFDPNAQVSPMYVFVSRLIWFWQEAEDEPLSNQGWGISDFWGQKVMGTDALILSGAIISYKIDISVSGNYDFYANLRWDGASGLLKYRIDNGKWSAGFQPFFGEKGDVVYKWRFKEAKLGSVYLKKGEHTLTFLNQKAEDEVGRFQNIDYFYLTLND